jgi:hypothetical protein
MTNPAYSPRYPQRTATSALELYYEPQYPYNYASSSRSPPPAYNQLPRRSSITERQDGVQESYNKFTDEARRRSRRAREQLQLQQHNQQALATTSATKPRYTPYDAYYTSSPIDEDSDDDSEQARQSGHAFDAPPTSRHMRAQSSNSSASTTTSIAFPANTSSQRLSIATSTSSYSAPSSPFWQSQFQQQQQAAPSYSSPPDSPYTTSYTLFEDDQELSPTARRGSSSSAFVGATKLARRDSTSKRRSSAELARVDSSTQSVHSLDSPSSPDSTASSLDSPTRLDAARRQWDIINLRIGLSIFHAKQKIAQLHVPHTQHAR